MINLKIKINLDDAINGLNDIFIKQIPFAAFLALNEAVFKASNDVKRTMPYFIDGGPVAFTKRGVRFIKAKSKRELRATIYIPDQQWKYMRYVIDGGRKQWNKSLHGIGKPIYANVRFNKYGNIPGRARKEKVWRQGLSQLKGTSGPIQGELGKKEFIGTIKGLTGLWERKSRSGGLKLKILFDHNPVMYRKSFPFEKFARQFAVKRFKKAFNKKLQQVISKESRRGR